MEALQKLKSWLEAEKTNYDNINSTVVSDEAIKEAIRQIAFRDVMIKLLEFEGEETQEFLDNNFPTPLCEEIKHNAVNDGITTTNDTPAEYSSYQASNLKDIKENKTDFNINQ